MSWQDCLETSNATPQRALLEVIQAVDALFDAAKAPDTTFSKREFTLAANLVHRVATLRPLLTQGTRAELVGACEAMLKRIRRLRTTLGAPDVWDTSRPEGAALRWLQESTRLLYEVCRPS